MSNISKFEEVQLEVVHVQDIMADNIKKLSQNMVDLEELEDKTNDLRENSKSFQKQTNNLKYKFCVKNIKQKIIIFLIMMIIILIILLIIYIKYF